MTGVGLRRTALVTGGARRVGRAIVEDLAAHGWAVAIHHGRSGQEAADLCAAVRAAAATRRPTPHNNGFQNRQMPVLTSP